MKKGQGGKGKSLCTAPTLQEITGHKSPTAACRRIDGLATPRCPGTDELEVQADQPSRAHRTSSKPSAKRCCDEHGGWHVGDGPRETVRLPKGGVTGVLWSRGLGSCRQARVKAGGRDR